MQLKDIFSENISITLHDVFQKYHITIPEKFEFSKTNIVIGSNGSGKTRLLRALKELYDVRPDTEVLYGYFPALSDHRIERNEEKIPDVALSDYGIDGVKFSDFFKEIESSGLEHLYNLFGYQSRLSRDRNKQALQLLLDGFQEWTGKQLHLGNSFITATREDDVQEPLSNALKLFSPGELVLLYIAIFLTIRKPNNEHRIIILDEPECHVHPKALIAFIKAIISTQQYESIWIATHSLFLIPEFDFEDIIFLEKGEIQKRGGQIYEKLLVNLLGEQTESTRNFFASLSQWQFCEYISKCFIDPPVIETIDPEDEQVRIFKQYLQNHKPIRILDFGGGSARLGLSLMAASDGQFDPNSYDIYDINPKYDPQKGKYKFGVYKDFQELVKSDHHYHCVVMMNFLHEFEPHKWPTLFSEVAELIEEGGYLLFVEVTALSEGEMPNDMGYFLLGKDELEILFSATVSVAEVKVNDVKKSIGIPIAKDKLSHVTYETVCAAIKNLENRSYRDIEQLRREAALVASKKENLSPAKARRYAFLVQQHINAQLFNSTVKTMRQAFGNKTRINDYDWENFGNFSYLQDNTTKMMNVMEKILERIPSQLEHESGDNFSNGQEILDRLLQAFNLIKRKNTVINVPLFQSCRSRIAFLKGHNGDPALINDLRTALSFTEQIIKDM